MSYSIFDASPESLTPGSDAFPVVSDTIKEFLGINSASKASLTGISDTGEAILNGVKDMGDVNDTTLFRLSGAVTKPVRYQAYLILKILI